VKRREILVSTARRNPNRGQDFSHSFETWISRFARNDKKSVNWQMKDAGKSFDLSKGRGKRIKGIAILMVAKSVQTLKTQKAFSESIRYILGGAT